MKKLLSLNEKLLSSIESDFLGLANGKMGLCIYFYHLSRLENLPEYEKIAERLLEDILENISIDTSINVETGLAGIAIGMNHLQEAGFIEGDINNMLEEIDDKIFHCILFTEDSTSEVIFPEILHYLYYFYIRYKIQTEQEQKYVFEELILKMVELMYQKLSHQFLEEPLTFSINYHLPKLLYIIGKIISLDIYNYRIYKIVEELNHKIVGSFPVSHANRLFLLWGLATLHSHYPTQAFEEHIQLLKTHIDIDTILYKELNNKRIFLSNGVSFVYFLLCQLKDTNLDYSIDFDTNKIYNRIFHSEVWNTLEYDPLKSRTYYYGFLTGIPAPILALSFIRKNSDYEN